MADKPLWTCPRCGRSFANTNQWHACQDTSVDEHLATRTEHAVAIYEAVVDALEEAGEFRIHPQRTKIAFISRMTFAGVALGQQWADLSLILPEPLEDPRVRKLELFGPTSWGHTIRLRSSEEVDADVRTWLREALRRGDQETLDPSHEVNPITGLQLDVFWTGYRGRVESLDDELVVALPGYIADALALVDEVIAKVGGIGYPAVLIRRGGAVFVPVEPATALGDGDDTDVFLTVPS